MSHRWWQAQVWLFFFSKQRSRREQPDSQEPTTTEGGHPHLKRVTSPAWVSSERLFPSKSTSVVLSVEWRSQRRPAMGPGRCKKDYLSWSVAGKLVAVCDHSGRSSARPWDLRNRRVDCKRRTEIFIIGQSWEEASWALEGCDHNTPLFQLAFCLFQETISILIRI